MGGCVSRPTNVEQVVQTKNDYELVIRASKELEHVLDTRFGAAGKGLHEKADSVERYLSRDICRNIHYLATIRNKLVHEYGFNSIPDRPVFINKFVASEAQLRVILSKQAGGKQSDSVCKMQ